MYLFIFISSRYKFARTYWRWFGMMMTQTFLVDFMAGSFVYFTSFSSYLGVWYHSQRSSYLTMFLITECFRPLQLLLLIMTISGHLLTWQVQPPPADHNQRLQWPALLLILVNTLKVLLTEDWRSRHKDDKREVALVRWESLKWTSGWLEQRRRHRSVWIQDNARLGQLLHSGKQSVKNTLLRKLKSWQANKLTSW